MFLFHLKAGRGAKLIYSWTLFSYFRVENWLKIKELLIACFDWKSVWASVFLTSHVTVESSPGHHRFCIYVPGYINVCCCCPLPGWQKPQFQGENWSSAVPTGGCRGQKGHREWATCWSCCSPHREGGQWPSRLRVSKCDCACVKPASWWLVSPWCHIQRSSSDTRSLEEQYRSIPSSTRFLTEQHGKAFLTASRDRFPFPQDCLLKKVATILSLSFLSSPL